MQKMNSDDSDHLMDETALCDELGHLHTKSFRNSRWTVDFILRVLSVFLSTILCILLLLNFTLWRWNFAIGEETGEETAILHTTYSRDPSYMSLDHQFDHLWEPLRNMPHLIQIENADDGGEKEIVGISM